MNRLFAEMLERHTPKVNPAIMRGLACTMIPEAERYIDRVFEGASRSFPPGLEYVGYVRCTPEEEFNEVTRVRNGKRTYDVARSDLYLVKYLFKYKGVDLPPRFLYLPYVLDGGIIHLGGSRFHISPVLKDPVISPAKGSVFVGLLRDKFTFKRLYHSVKINGRTEPLHVVWSSIYRKNTDNNKVPATTKAVTCATHYLLGKYGLRVMFGKFCGFEPVVGDSLSINSETHPCDRWVIFSSSKVKPNSYIGSSYYGNDLRLAIPVERCDAFVKSLVAGVFYVVDNFPDRIDPKWVDNTERWLVLLGHAIFSGKYSEPKLYKSVGEHYQSLDNCLDQIVVEKLKESGYPADDFYELLALIIRNYDGWDSAAHRNNTNVYGKTMEVLYYVLYDVTSAIFNFSYKLSKRAQKKELQPKDIIDIANQSLNLGVIYGLTKQSTCLSTVAYSGDHMYPKITSVVALQKNSGAKRGGHSRSVLDESDHLHVSAVEAGSVLFLPKSNPRPQVRANMFLNVDLSTGKVLPKPYFKALREKTMSDVLGHPYVEND
jgi:hypothetical protein